MHSLTLATHSDTTDELLTVTGLFSHFYSLDTTIKERQFFKRCDCLSFPLGASKLTLLLHSCRLAQLIGTRAARLSACGIAAIVSKQGYLEDGCGIATDGSLYNVSCLLAPLIYPIAHSISRPSQKYPKFPERLGEGLVDIFGEKGK